MLQEKARWASQLPAHGLPGLPGEGMLDCSSQQVWVLSEKAMCVYPQTHSASTQGPYKDPNAGFPRSRTSEDNVPRFLPVKELDMAQTALVRFLFSKMGYEHAGSLTG